MKILITGAANPQAYQVKKLFTGEHVLVLGDSMDLPEFMLKTKTMLKLPAVDSASFAHEVLTLCLDEQIDLLVPLRQAELLPLAKARILFEEYGIALVVPSLVRIESMSACSSPEGEIYVQYFADNENGSMSSENYGVFAKNNDGSLCIFTAD